MLNNGVTTAKRRHKVKAVFVAITACILFLKCTPHIVAQDVQLVAPLTTIVYADIVPSGDKIIEVDITVPPNAPNDLGVGAFCADHDGRWFQRPAAGILKPGQHRLIFNMDRESALISEPDHATWLANKVGFNERAGVFFWSAQNNNAVITISRLQVISPLTEHAKQRANDNKLLNLTIDGIHKDDGCAHVTTGSRWTIETTPRPFPENPYDAQQFALDAIIVTPTGKELRIPGFYCEPRTSADRGDQEVMARSGPGRFVVRFRPTLPGRYKVRLQATWHNQSENKRVDVTLPDLIANGPARDEVVRVDPHDSRFLTVAGQWYWPIGVNMHAANDLLCRDFYSTVLTPNRSGLVFQEAINRFAANGVNLVEIWLASWGLGLEGRRDLPGFHGYNRYNQDNAARLDELLDAAWDQGVRINLVINHYTQASTDNPPESEWHNNPYNHENGGPLQHPDDIFDAPAALAGQENMRRYLIARYADHPGIFGWELWSESNLVSASQRTVAQWHEHAVKRWHELDVYDHMVSAHWSEDYRRVSHQVASVDSLDLLAVDAYRRHPRWYREINESLADVLADTIYHESKGMGRYGHPVLITEYGATSTDSPDGLLAVDHTTSAWSALVCGHAGSPMMWWWEWVDQNEAYAPYRAVANFIKGEDLRDKNARSIKIASLHDQVKLWGRAWSRPGRMWGYVHDYVWSNVGGTPQNILSAQLLIGTNVQAGPMVIEWWDADQGVLREVINLEHPGGKLFVAVPEFAGHIMFKLFRTPNAVLGVK